MIIIDRTTIPRLLPGSYVIEFRVYNNATHLWEWVDFSSRYVSFSDPQVRAENSQGVNHCFDAFVSSITLKDNDNYFSKGSLNAHAGSLELVNPSEPYGRQLRGRWVRVGRKYTYPDGLTTTIYLGCGYVSDMSRDNEKGQATFTLESLARRAMDQRADGAADSGGMVCASVDQNIVVNPDFGDVLTSTALLKTFELDPETGVITRSWFENRKATDILHHICNALNEECDIAEFKLQGATGARVASTLTRPPDDSVYSSAYCRAGCWDPTNKVLWLGIDDPLDPTNSYIYKYDPDTDSYTKAVKIAGGGRIQKLWFNTATNEILGIAHPDIANGVATRTTTAYAFKFSVAITPVVTLTMPGDALATLSDYCPGTFCYHDASWCDSGFQNGFLIAHQIGGEHPLQFFDEWSDENLNLPFEQSLIGYVDSHLAWDHSYYLKKLNWLTSRPNACQDPPPTWTNMIANSHVARGTYCVRSKNIRLQETQDFASPNLRTSYGQDGTTVFWPGRGAAGSIMFVKHFARTGMPHYLFEVDVASGTVSHRAMFPTFFEQPIVCVPMDAATTLAIGTMYLYSPDQGENLPNYTNKFSLYCWTDAGGLGPKRIYDDPNSGGGTEMILNGYPLSPTRILGTIYNRASQSYRLAIVSTNTEPNHAFGSAQTLLSPSTNPPASGANRFGGFLVCDSAAPYNGDGKIYFFEQVTNFLYSYDPTTGIVQYENAQGGVPIPVVSGDSHEMLPLVLGAPVGVGWVIYGISCKQEFDKDGLPPDSGGQYVLWQYARWFSGYLELCDFVDMTLHDVRNQIAQALNAVHFYGPDAKWYFRQRPTTGTAVASFTDVLKIKKKNSGFQNMINCFKAIPYQVSIQPRPTSIPYSFRASGSDGTLERGDINYSGPDKVQEWRFTFTTDGPDASDPGKQGWFTVAYRVSGASAWNTPNPPSGNMQNDYRTVEANGDYILLPTHSWRGTIKAGDVYGFFVYPSTKALVQLTERELIEFRDVSHDLEWGRVEQGVDNRLAPRALLYSILSNLVSFWKDPRAEIEATGPILDGLLPLQIVSVTDGFFGTFLAYINGLSSKKDSPEMVMSLVGLSGEMGPGGAGPGT